MAELETELANELKAKTEDLDSLVTEALSEVIDTELYLEAFANQIQFLGKPLVAWAQELEVILPRAKDMTADDLRELHVRVCNNLQIASHYYNLCHLGQSVLKSGLTIKRGDLSTQILTEYDNRNLRRPSTALVERVVNTCVQKLNSMNNISSMLKAFWREKMEILKEVKTSLNNIAMSKAVEMKYLENE